MTTALWIVVAVVAALVLIALVAGLVISRRRRITLRAPDAVDGGGTAVEAPRKGGSYQASGGFSFSSGGTATAEPPTAADERAPAAADAAAGADAPTTATDETAPAADDTAPATDRADAATTAGATGAATTAGDIAAVPDIAAAAGTATGPDTASGATTGTAAPVPDAAPATDSGPATDEGPTADEVRTPPGGIAAAGTATEARTPPDGMPVTVLPGNDVPTPPSGTPATAASATDDLAADAATPATGTAAVAPTDTALADSAPADTAPAAPPVAPTPTPAAAPPVGAAIAEPIAPTSGRLERLRGNLSRSRSAFGQSLLGLLGAGDLDEESWEDVEATLLQADLGPDMTAELVETLRAEIVTRGVRTPDQARALLRDVLTRALEPGTDRSVAALPHDGRPAVLLVVGVNGTGKTTTTGKLARVLVADGRHVVLGAADTFRAAAAEQLQTWGERAGAVVVRGPEGSDPASVAFDAVKRGTADGADAVLLDTAGRLHTKTGLMDELGKVKRVVEKQAEVDEVLLVLDATTGQNGLIQARVFGDVVKVTGIVLTKLDGTAKGGIVFRVQRELGVPVKLVGLGEGPDDLAPFEPGAFVDALLA